MTKNIIKLNKTSKIKRSKSFGTIAKNYQKYRNSYDKKVFYLLAKLLGGSKEKLKILDIGCGTGKSTEPLTEVFNNSIIIGCDPDKEMLKIAKSSAKDKNLTIKYVLGRAEEITFKKEIFDSVIAGTAFHWFDNKKALNEIKRVLKPKGVFFVFWRKYKDDDLIDWQGLNKKYKIKSFVSKYKKDPDLVKNLFESVGFKNIDINVIKSINETNLEKIIGAIKTNSSYLTMKEEKKEKYLKEIEESILSSLGNKKTIKQHEEIIMIYGKK